MSLQNPASTAAKPDAPEAKTSNFLRQIIEHDLAAGTYAHYTDACNTCGAYPGIRTWIII